MSGNQRILVIVLPFAVLFLLLSCGGSRGRPPGGVGADRTAPHFTQVPRCSDPEGDFQFVCSATGEDETSRMLTYYWTVTNGLLALRTDPPPENWSTEVAVSRPNGSRSQVLWDLIREPDGTYAIMVVIEDEAGNRSLPRTFIVTKTTPEQGQPEPPPSPEPANQPPEIKSLSLSDNGDRTFDLTAVAVDPDGDQVTYSWSSSSGELALKSTSQVTLQDGPKPSGEPSVVLLSCTDGGQVEATVTATDAAGNASDPSTITLNCPPPPPPVENRDIPPNTFSFWLLDKSGNPLPTATGGDEPVYEVEPGECYWLVAATGEFLPTIPANVDAATLATYTGSNAFADAVIDFVWGPQEAISLVAFPQSVNPGPPDVPLLPDCSGLAGFQGRYLPETDDGIYDLGSAEALGGSAPLFDVANGLPPLKKVRVVRGTIGADGSVDWTTTEELANVTEWAFGGRLSGTSFATEEVVPSQDVAIISVAIKINADAGTDIVLSFLDSIYLTGGNRPTLGDATQNKDNFLTFYKNLAQEKIIPNLQDVTLLVR